MDGSTEFEVDEEVGADVMVVVSVSSEDASELAGDLMVMVNISSGAADTASKCVMSNASAYLVRSCMDETALEHTNADMVINPAWLYMPLIRFRGGGGGGGRGC